MTLIAVVTGAVRAVVPLPTLLLLVSEPFFWTLGPPGVTAHSHCISKETRWTSKESHCESLRRSATPDLVTEYENAVCLASYFCPAVAACSGC